MHFPILLMFKSNTIDHAYILRCASKTFCAGGRKLFEEGMSAFLAEEGCTQADFVAIIKRAHREGVAGTENMGSLLVDAMSAIDDFESFVFFMGTVVVDEASGDRHRRKREDKGQTDGAYHQRSDDRQHDETQKDVAAGTARRRHTSGRK